MRKKKQKKKQEQRELKKYIAFNSHLIILTIGLIAFLVMSVVSFIDDFWLGIIFSVFALFIVFVICIQPFYYTFTEKDVTLIYILGIKEKIEWRDVRCVVRKSSFTSAGAGFPHYEIFYATAKKYPFFVNSEIARTRKTKKLLKAFCPKEII